MKIFTRIGSAHELAPPACRGWARLLFVVATVFSAGGVHATVRTERDLLMERVMAARRLAALDSSAPTAQDARGVVRRLAQWDNWNNWSNWGKGR